MYRRICEEVSRGQTKIEVNNDRHREGLHTATPPSEIQKILAYKGYTWSWSYSSEQYSLRDSYTLTLYPR